MRRASWMLALAAACAHAPVSPAPPTPDAASDPAEAASDVLFSLRAEARALIERQSDLAWRRWALGEEIDLRQSYAGHETLFTPAAIARVAKAAAAAQGDLKRALSALHLYLVGERIALATAPLAEKAERLLAGATVEAQGRTIPYRELAALASREPDWEMRAKWAAAELGVLGKLAPILDERDRAVEAVGREVGFASYLELASALRGASPGSLAALAEATLGATDALWPRALASLARRESMDPARVRWADLGRLLRAPAGEGAFPGGGALSAVQRTLAGLGIDLVAQKNVLVHADPLPAKDPRAVAMAVRVPDDVRVSLKPRGGAEDYRALLHEMGHAQHFAHAQVAHWELGLLGNRAATETYGFLFESLVDEPAWLVAHTRLSGEPLAAYLRENAARQLYFLRRAAARVLFEVEWRGGKAADPAARWRELMGRACGCALAPEDGARWIADRDEFLSAADDLRARVAAAQVAEVLAARAGGAPWWSAKEAGDALRAAWRLGTARSVEESMGLGALDPKPLVRRAEAQLGP